jgi:uncharacterized damage-inducible protein DinB
MSHPLTDPFRHEAWATRALLEVCRGLTPEELDATATGAYGSVRATMQHMIRSSGWYRTLFTRRPPAWYPRARDEDVTLDDLAAWAQDNAAGWERLLEEGIDPERRIRYDEDGEDWEVAAGVLVTQVLNHGNEHRDQVCTILTTLGIQAPELDGWAYGEAVGRSGPAGAGGS